MKFKPLIDSTILATGAIQKIFTAGLPGVYFGILNLSELQAGDTVDVAMKLEGDVYYHKIYSGVQPDPVLYVKPRQVISRMDITIEQTAGTFRSFEFKFFVYEESVITNI